MALRGLWLLLFVTFLAIAVKDILFRGERYK
jgi:hypothetical protein